MTLGYQLAGNTITPLFGRFEGTDDVSAGNIIDFSPAFLNEDYALITASLLPSSGGGSAIPYIAPIDAPLIPASGLPGQVTLSANYLYSGLATNELNRQRGNQDITLLTSAARSSTTASSDTTNHNSKGGHFVIDVTNVASTGTLTPTIEGKDSVSSEYYTILTGLEITAVGTYVVKVYPGVGQIPNGAASDILPKIFRINIVYGGSGDVTYSVGCALIM